MSKINVSLVAFKKLVKKYRSITKKQVEKITSISNNLGNNEVLTTLTAFSLRNCILCKSVSRICPSCLHTQYQQSFDNSTLEDYNLNEFACFKKRAWDTYSDLKSPFTTYEDFMVLVNARADYLQLIINWYEKEH